MGHLLLVGESGVDKTVLSRFVAWMNGLSVLQVWYGGREGGRERKREEMCVCMCCACFSFSF